MNQVPEQSRRKALKSIGLAVTTIPVFAMLGCNSSNSSDGINTTAGTTTTTTTGTSTNTGDWAVGGTDLITDNFPEDSLFDTATACTIALTKSTTEGPCYFANDASEDISTGLTGLPMMLCLRLVDSNCQPLAGYEIAVWHCDTQGIYSGDTRGC